MSPTASKIMKIGNKAEMDEIPEEKLVQQCQNNELGAFDILMKRYQDRIYNTMYRMMGNTTEAEEVTQEAFLNAYRAIKNYDGQAQFYTWLYRIAVNASISRMRSLARERRYGPRISLAGQDDDERGGGFHPQDESQSPTAIVEQSERERLVQQAIAELDEDSRTVVVLKDIEGMEIQDISKVLDCPSGTIKSRLHRARLQLKEKLERAL